MSPSPIKGNEPTIKPARVRSFFNTSKSNNSLHDQYDTLRCGNRFDDDITTTTVIAMRFRRRSMTNDENGEMKGEGKGDECRIGYLVSRFRNVWFARNKKIVEIFGWIVSLVDKGKARVA